MECQGYGVRDNILFQDNMSSMLLEKNGKALSGKWTKHINTHYFFITNRISQGELSVQWCPMGDMVGDFATKPLQGALFHKFRDQIMGVMPMGDGNHKKHMKDSKPAKGMKKFGPAEGRTTGVCWRKSRVRDIPKESYQKAKCVSEGWTDMERSS